MEFVVKKTTELNDVEKIGLLDLFHRIFEKERTSEEFNNQYLQNPFGYCYHSLIIDNNQIVGAHTAFPSFYWFGEKKVKAFITGDTMVDKAYRDGLSFLDMIKTLDKCLIKEGFAFGFGFPNDNSYPVFIKVKLSKDIGRLDTYILPYRIGGIKKTFRLLNPFSKLFCKIWIAFSSINLSDEFFCPLIHKDEETYNLTRYKRLDGNYQHVVLDGTEFYYTIKVHEGVKTAFLIDVVRKSERSFHKAVKYIMNNERNKFDLLMYVGYLPKCIRKIGLVKIPRKYEPKHFYMTGGRLDKKFINDAIFFDISNWDVNLSNYDII